jgi:hypothetical protein
MTDLRQFASVGSAESDIPRDKRVQEVDPLLKY